MGAIHCGVAAIEEHDGNHSLAFGEAFPCLMEAMRVHSGSG